MDLVLGWLRSAQWEATHYVCAYPTEPGAILVLDMVGGGTLAIQHAWMCRPVGSGGGTTSAPFVDEHTQFVDIGNGKQGGIFLEPDLARFLIEEDQRLYSSATSGEQAAGAVGQGAAASGVLAPP